VPEPEDYTKHLEAIFFRGALSGWAGGYDGLPLQDSARLPGQEDWKEVVYQDRSGYTFFDRWGTDPQSKKPSGHLLIMHGQTPVWTMWVGGGEYEMEVLPFLQQVLRETYVSELFLGGRGLRELRIDNLLYTNTFEGNFTRFRGQEKVEYIEASGKKHLAGFHDYWGGSLVYQQMS
jgi:hypothetical protein